MVKHFTVKNWQRFQHYKDRNPPWIKLHFELLSSETWVMLDDASRVLAVACMLIASRNEGMVPNNPDYVKRVAYLNTKPNFKPLIECGFLENPLADASKPYQMQADARPEAEAEAEAEDAALPARARDPTAFQKIYEAGCAVFPNLATANTSSIRQWIAAGCDADLDAVPEIQRLAAAGRSVKAWAYFTDPIMNAKATREAPPPKGKPRETTRNAHASAPRFSKTERAKAALLRSANALGYGPDAGQQGPPGADESGLSVFPGPENLREGA